MAEATTQYNLQSSKMDLVHVPVKHQFSDDSQFISQLLKQQEQSVQVSDNSLASDLNCSDLVQLDGEANVVNDKNVSNSDSAVSDNPSTSTGVTQDMINGQILAQLQNIGQRLTKIESTQCKKVLILQRSKVLQRRWQNINSRDLGHTATGTRQNNHKCVKVGSCFIPCGTKYF